MFPRLLAPSSPLLLLMVWLPFCTGASARTDDSDAKAPLHAKPPPPPTSHKVVRGETLWGIAMKYNTSVGEIMDLNHLETNKVKEGQVLKLPVDNPAPPVPPPNPKNTYLIKEDDTLRSITKALHCSQDDLEASNPLANLQHPHPGVRLIIPPRPDKTKAKDKDKDKETDRDKDKEKPKEKPAPAPIVVKTLVDHTVEPDETFSSMARHFGVKVEDIIAANPEVKPERLHDGMVVKIPGKAKAADHPAPRKPRDDSTAAVEEKPKTPPHPEEKPKPAVAEAPVPKPPKTLITTKPPAPKDPPEQKSHPKDDPPANRDAGGDDGSYVVRSGETLEDVAKAHGVGAKRLREFNRLSPEAKLRAGDEIMIPRRSEPMANR